MRYWIPELQLGAISPPQTQLQDKFGGWPWGLPQERWPLCKSCSNPLIHLATLTHNSERFDLGKEGRLVMVFQCRNTDCAPWDAYGGGNVVLFLDTNEQINSLTIPPEPIDSGEIEARVMAWLALEDTIPETLYNDFFGYAHDDLPKEVTENIYAETKIGSVPCWLQGPEEGPKSPYRFVAQFGPEHHFPGPIPTHLESLRHNSDDKSYRCEAAYYGDEGTAYLFITEQPAETLFDSVPLDISKPSGLFFWQTT